MIQTFIAKIIIKRIFKAIQRKREWKRIDEYVNKPNELDVQLKQSQKTIIKYGQYIEGLEKEVANLKANSHPPLFTLNDKTDIMKRLKKLEKGEAK